MTWWFCPLPKEFEGDIGMALRWRHNYHDGVSNHQPHGCLLNRLFRRKSKKTPNPRVTGLCVGNSPGPVNSPHKGPVTRKMFPFDDVIMALVCMASWITHTYIMSLLIPIDFRLVVHMFFEIPTWELLCILSKLHDILSSHFAGIGTLWPTLHSKSKHR